MRPDVTLDRAIFAHRERGDWNLHWALLRCKCALVLSKNRRVYGRRRRLCRSRVVEGHRRSLERSFSADLSVQLAVDISTSARRRWSDRTDAAPRRDGRVLAATASIHPDRTGGSAGDQTTEVFRSADESTLMPRLG